MSWSPRLLSILRIVTALLFLEHGTMKLFGFPISPPGAPDHLPLLLQAAAAIELVGGVMLVLGLFTRVVAFVCAGEMAVAYFMAHAPAGFWPAVNGGEGAILFCFVFLYFAAAGAGPWSIDALRGISPSPGHVGER